MFSYSERFSVLCDPKILVHPKKGTGAEMRSFADMLIFKAIPSLTIPPGDPRGFAHSSCPRGRVFTPLFCPRVCPGVCPGVLSQSKSSIVLKKSAIFTLFLKQLSSSSFRMFIYARSEQHDLVLIYTITNTQRIKVYPSKFKFILVKILSAPRQKETKLYSRFLPLRIYLCSPVHECKYGEYSDLFSYG